LGANNRCNQLRRGAMTVNGSRSYGPRASRRIDTHTRTHSSQMYAGCSRFGQEITRFTSPAGFSQNEHFIADMGYSQRDYAPTKRNCREPAIALIEGLRWDEKVDPRSRIALSYQ
jgi:hypothetical protein